MNLEVNYLAVLLAGVAAMVTGFLWYGALFGKAWAREMGWGELTPEQNQKLQEGAKTAYPQQFVGALIMAYVFAHVLSAFEASTIGDALMGAFWVWLGFIVPVKWGDTLWAGKSKKLFALDSLYLLLNLAVFGVIFTLWK